MFKMNEKEAARWEKAHDKGKWFYVSRKTIIFSLGGLALFLVTNSLYDRSFGLEPIALIACPIINLFGAMMEWWRADAQYQTYILDSKISKGLNS